MKVKRFRTARWIFRDICHHSKNLLTSKSKQELKENWYWALATYRRRTKACRVCGKRKGSALLDYTGYRCPYHMRKLSEHIMLALERRKRKPA